MFTAYVSSKKRPIKGNVKTIKEIRRFLKEFVETDMEHIHINIFFTREYQNKFNTMPKIEIDSMDFTGLKDFKEHTNEYIDEMEKNLFI